MIMLMLEVIPFVYVSSLDYVLFFALKMLQRQFQSLSLPINMVTYTVEDACISTKMIRIKVI